MKFILTLFTLLSTIATLAQVPTSNLQGLWFFDGNANDSLSTGNNGNVFGAQLVNDRCGNPNSAYSFDGVDDYIEFTTDTLDVADEVSVSLWFRSNTNDLDAILSKYSWTNDIGYVVQFDSYGAPEFRGRDGNNDFSETGTDDISRLDNKWHHFVGITDGPIWYAYIDTVLVGSFNNSHTSVNIGSCSLPLTMGRLAEYTGASWRYFSGELDDIAIYNRAINFQEIIALYDAACKPATLKIEKFSKDVVQAYPNPSVNGLFNITLPKSVTKDKIEKVWITDITGKLINVDLATFTTQQSVMLKDQTKGLYILNIQVKNSVYQSKLVLK